jgi:hypothetical protein
MERTGKYEKFPVLQPGDVVVCRKHTAYIVTHGGGYRLMESLDRAEWMSIVGYVNNLDRLFCDCVSCEAPQYTPEAVFRPSSGYTIPTGIISNMIADWRLVNPAHGETFSRVWSIDDVKELTVDEVSKLLGYKVKIVGSDE